VGDSAYLLGLSDEDPHRIVLRKGALVNGAGASSGTGLLLASGATFAQGTWLHIRLDAIVQPNNDVVLAVFQNDLTAHPLGTPADWEPVAGMANFIDDKLGINSGTQPFVSGRGGFGFSVKDVTRRSFVDQIELWRQL
jgi:hypothetical protein